MEKEICVIWIDWVNRIITFRETSGFERVECADRRALMAFALEKGSDGFAVQ